MKMGAIEWIVLVLVIVGGLNWGLIGFFDYNLVDALFGVGSTVSSVIYGLVGLASIWLIFLASKMSRE